MARTISSSTSVPFTSMAASKLIRGGKAGSKGVGQPQAEGWEPEPILGKVSVTSRGRRRPPGGVQGYARRMPFDWVPPSTMAGEEGRTKGPPRACIPRCGRRSSSSSTPWGPPQGSPHGAASAPTEGDWPLREGRSARGRAGAWGTAGARRGCLPDTRPGSRRVSGGKQLDGLDGRENDGPREPQHTQTKRNYVKALKPYNPFRGNAGRPATSKGKRNERLDTYKGTVTVGQRAGQYLRRVARALLGEGTGRWYRGRSGGAERPEAAVARGCRGLRRRGPRPACSGTGGELGGVRGVHGARGRHGHPRRDGSGRPSLKRLPEAVGEPILNL
eukprot:2391079-Pyramimonas_sp.AAC.2